MSSLSTSSTGRRAPRGEQTPRAQVPSRASLRGEQPSVPSHRPRSPRRGEGGRGERRGRGFIGWCAAGGSAGGAPPGHGHERGVRVREGPGVGGWVRQAVQRRRRGARAREGIPRRHRRTRPGTRRHGDLRRGDGDRYRLPGDGDIGIPRIGARPRQTRRRSRGARSRVDAHVGAHATIPEARWVHPPSSPRPESAPGWAPRPGFVRPETRSHGVRGGVGEGGSPEPGAHGGARARSTVDRSHAPDSRAPRARIAPHRLGPSVRAARALGGRGARGEEGGRGGGGDRRGRGPSSRGARGGSGGRRCTPRGSP